MTQDRTWAQLAFDRLVSEHIAPMLKRHGFRKSGLNWFVRRDESPQGWGIINLQKSSFGTRDDIRFTLNLSVTHDKKLLAKRPPYYACEQRARIGHFLPTSQNIWWNIDGGRWSPGEGPDCLLPILEALLPLLESKGVAWVKSQLAGPPATEFRFNPVSSPKD